MVEFPVPVKPVYSSPTCCPVLTVSVPPVVRGRHGEEVDGVEEPVVVAGRIGREKAAVFDRPSTGDPPVGVKVSSVPAIGLKLEKKWPEFGWP